MEIIDEEKRKMIKEQAYNKYADIIRTMMSKQYYSDFDNMVSSLIALNLAAEATQKTLISSGADKALVEKASEVARKEMATLMEMNDKGMLKGLKKTKKKTKKRKEE